MSEWIKAFPVPFTNEYRRAHPNASLYCMYHGLSKMIPKAYPPDLKGYKNTEAVYEECLERGCTWEELLNYKENPDVIL